MRKQKAVIDASNILHLEVPTQQKPRIETIYAVIDAVKASGREPILVVEAAALSTVGDPENGKTPCRIVCPVNTRRF